MNPDNHQGQWAIARLLFATQIPFLLVMWVGLAVLFFAIIAIWAVVGTVSNSVWDFAPLIVRWAALFYGIHFTKTLLPFYIANGHSRADFLRQVPPFLLIVSLLFGGFMALGYGLEGMLYNTMGWEQSVSPHRFFSAPDETFSIFLTYVILFLGMILVGAVGAAGFHYSRDYGTLTFGLGLALAVAVLFAVDGGDLPFIRRVLTFPELPYLVKSLLGGTVIVTGYGLLWGIVRSIPIRIPSL